MIENNRTSFGKRLSDAFFPKDIRDFLYTDLMDVGPAKINGWSFMHMFSGIIIGLLGFKFWSAFFIHLAWEIFQATIGDNKLDAETLIDVPLDTLFFLFGWYLVYIVYCYEGVQLF
jgi:hypothetical protein